MASKSRSFKVFSSDSSDEDDTPKQRRVITDASDSDRRNTVSIKVNMNDTESSKSGSESDSTKYVSKQGAAPPTLSYVPIDKNRVAKLKHNTKIQYETKAGKLIKSKYFKKCDLIAGTITVGFYQHNKKNYSQSLADIKKVFVNREATGGAGDLQGTIEIPNSDWKSIRRDMVISYEKDDHEFVYRAKFNSFMKGPDDTTKMSLTSERGFNYIANPSKILKIYRHMTSNDKTLSFILEALRKMEIRVKQLEANQKK